MAVRVVVDREARLVRSTFTGHVSLVDFLDGRLSTLNHADWSRSFAHVLDLTEVTNLDIPEETLRQIAALRPIFEPNVLQVVVARPDSPVSEFVRTFQRFAQGSGRDVRIVESLEEANALVSRD